MSFSQHLDLLFCLYADKPIILLLYHLQKKYKEQYEKMKHKYTSIHDTPILVRSKKAYLNASDVSQPDALLLALFDISNRALLKINIIPLQLRYKETFELSKGHYHADKDALDILCAKRVRDDISEVSKLKDLQFALNMNVIY